MNIAKLVSNSPNFLESQNIIKSFEEKYGTKYASDAIKLAVQLGLLIEESGKYQVNVKHRDVIKRANKEDLKIILRNALQNFPPFLLYADFLSTGYPSKEAANMTRGLMGINSNSKVVEKCLRLWGTDTGLIINKDGKIIIPEAEKGLPATYIKELLKALDSELRTKMFFINTLTPEVYNCLVQWNLNIDELAKSLLDYETNPKQSLERAAQFFESFLHKLGTDAGISLIGFNGVNSAVNELFRNNKILKNQQHLGNGIGGIRNISAHGVDSETQKPWNITSQASLSGILLIPAVIRSYYLFVKNNTQDF